ncbi:MAG: hypothetical protein NT149_01755 [Candidatus Gottesmanbacteria bacterium]|nr:hypothetical protein [Candidatus Gottesmanbacteria bacterium]
MHQIFAVNIGDPNVFAPAATFPTFGAIVSIVVKNAVVFAGIISFVLLIIGGLGVIVGAGSGDTKKLEQSKKAVTGAVMGLLIIVLSVLIVQVIATITGVPELQQIVGLK